MANIIIAIDGVSGSGKSTTAKAVARELGYSYIDTGAMYRAVTWYFLDQEVDISDSAEVDDALNHISLDVRLNLSNKQNEIFLNGSSVDDKLRSMEVNQHVSAISALPAVRLAMRSTQQEMGGKKGVVMDGRDIGTAVFPKAELKLFLTADVKVRAKRRSLDFKEAGEEVRLSDIQSNLEERDRQDTTRDTSPLIKAPDAYEIDTSSITLEEQIQKVLGLARQTINTSS